MIDFSSSLITSVSSVAQEGQKLQLSSKRNPHSQQPELNLVAIVTHAANSYKGIKQKSTISIINGEKTLWFAAKTRKRFEASLSRLCCLDRNAAWEMVFGYCRKKNIFVLAKYLCTKKYFCTGKYFVLE